MKYVVITGSATGLGLALSRYCLGQGLAVYGTFNQIRPDGQLSDRYPERYRPIRLDVTDPAAVSRAAEMVEAELDGNRLHAVVNAAAIVRAGPLLLQTPVDLLTVLQVNVVGSFLISKAFIPLLGDPKSGDWGKIINISSVGSELALPFQGSYGISKSALNALGDALRLERLPEHRYLVSTILLGLVRTGLHEREMERADRMQNTPYEARVTRFIDQVRRRLNAGLSPEAAAAAVYRIAMSERPRPYHIVAANPTSVRILLLARRRALFLRWIRNHFFGPDASWG